MKKTLHRKKKFLVLFFLVLSSCLACDQIGSGSFIEIEDETQQYEKIEQELKDLKTIKVKCLAPEHYAKMKEKIFENYFRYNHDTEHLAEQSTDDKYGGEHSIVYETEDMYQLMEWGDSFVYYSGTLFGEDYIYETTKEDVIQEETGKLFELLGLAFDNSENGYVIDRIIVQADHRTEVYIKKYIEGKELSLAIPPALEDMPDKVDDIVIEFGNNQIIGIYLGRLSEVSTIQDYEEEVVVDHPEKAYKLLVNYINSTQGEKNMTVDIVRIAYMTRQEKDGEYILRPMVDFYTKVNDVRKVYQVDLTTKEVWDTIYCSNMIIDK